MSDILCDLLIGSWELGPVGHYRAVRWRYDYESSDQDGNQYRCSVGTPTGVPCTVEMG